jgi:hypothetical protein
MNAHAMIRPYLVIAGFLAPMLLLSSCLMIRPAGTRSGGKLFETFYTGETGTQYFIKPLSFLDGKDILQADFTFRYLDRLQDSATVNFSLYQAAMVRQVDSLVLIAGKKQVTLHRPALLFNEKHGKGFHSRFSGKVALETLDALFKQPVAWSVQTAVAGRQQNYQPDSRSAKALKKLRENLFILF